MFLDRTAFGLLAPMIQPEFHLTNTDIGLVNAVLAVTWSLASFWLPRGADLTRQKQAAAGRGDGDLLGRLDQLRVWRSGC